MFTAKGNYEVDELELGFRTASAVLLETWNPRGVIAGRLWEADAGWMQDDECWRY